MMGRRRFDISTPPLSHSLFDSGRIGKRIGGALNRASSEGIRPPREDATIGGILDLGQLAPAVYALMLKWKIQHRPASLRTFLVLIVLIAILPALIFSGILAEHLVKAKFETNQQSLRRTADDLAMAVDQEFETTTRTLQSLT